MFGYQKTKTSSRRELPRVLAGVVALVVAICIGSAISAEHSVKESDHPWRVAASNLPLVEVIDAEPATTVEELRRFSGLLESRRTSPLSFERIGRLAEVRVDEGDEVRKGDVLAKLASDKLFAERERLLAEKAAEEAQLAELVAGPRSEQIAAAKARVDQSNARLDLARKNLRRRERLADKNLVSDESYESAFAEVETRSAEARVLEQELLELENGSRAERIAAKRAQIRAIEAAIEVVEVDLEETTIKAPYSGSIIARGSDEGTIVAPGQMILQISETNELRARFGVPIDVASNVVIGEEVMVEANGQTFAGKVAARVSRVAASTRTQTLLVSMLTNAQDRLCDGQAVRLHVSETANVEGCWIPRAALTRGTRGLWNCYVLDPQSPGVGSVKRRIVEVLHVSTDRVAVKGLKRGESIVASAPHRVASGQQVRVRLNQSDAAIAKQQSTLNDTSDMGFPNG